MHFFKFLFVPLMAIFMVGCAKTQIEPVDPQPASPLFFQHDSYHKVTPDVAKALMELGFKVIDVREVDEYQQGHIKGSINVPLSTMEEGMILEAVPNLNEPILVHCRSGVRAENASKILVNSGYKYVFNMYGILQWPYDLVTD